MTDKTVLARLHKMSLEESIINYLAEKKSIDLRTAMNIYYTSRLSVEIEEGLLGIENLDYKYLTHDLIDNEQHLFV